MSTAPFGSGEMFDAIAPRYDLVNRVISLGIDQSWRRRTVEALALEGRARVLDLATGTGDLALAIAARYPEAHIVGTDPSLKMLAVATTKVERAALGSRITLSQGDAETLNFPDQSVDALSMAFGIRNVPDRSRALREMARVVRVGGRIAILELSEPTMPLLGSLARFHIHTVVPAIGAALSGAREYRYLERSIAAFPDRESFAEKMREAGLTVVTAQPLTFGVATLFIAERGL